MHMLQYPFTTFSNSPSEEDLSRKPKINATTAWTTDSRSGLLFFKLRQIPVQLFIIKAPQNKSVGRLIHNKARTFLVDPNGLIFQYTCRLPSKKPTSLQ